MEIGLIEYIVKVVSVFADIALIAIAIKLCTGTIDMYIDKYRRF